MKRTEKDSKEISRGGGQKKRAEYQFRQCTGQILSHAGTGEHETRRSERGAVEGFGSRGLCVGKKDFLRAV